MVAWRHQKVFRHVLIEESSALHYVLIMWFLQPPYPFLFYFCPRCFSCRYFVLYCWEYHCVLFFIDIPIWNQSKIQYPLIVNGHFNRCFSPTPHSKFNNSNLSLCTISTALSTYTSPGWRLSVGFLFRRRPTSVASYLVLSMMVLIRNMKVNLGAVPLNYYYYLYAGWGGLPGLSGSASSNICFSM